MQHAKTKQPSYALPSSISSINSIFLDEEVKRKEKKKNLKIVQLNIKQVFQKQTNKKMSYLMFYCNTSGLYRRKLAEAKIKITKRIKLRMVVR